MSYTLHEEKGDDSASFVLCATNCETSHKCTKMHNGFVCSCNLDMTSAAKIETSFVLPPPRVLTENSRPGFGVSTAVLYRGFAAVISNTVTGLRTSVYDSGRRSRDTSKERDSETGLDYFGARYMSSAQGRFTSPDPANVGAFSFDPQSWNGYSYGRNNPLRYTDPDGLAYTVCQTDSDGKQTNCGDVASDTAFTDYQKNSGLHLVNGNSVVDNNGTQVGTADYYDAAVFASNSLGAQRIVNGAGPVVKTLAAATLLFTAGAAALEAAPAVTTFARAGLQRLAMAAENPTLKDVVNRLYQDSDQIAGGTAGAVRNEVSTGEYINQAGHFIKAAERITQLERLINSGKLSGSDTMIAGHIVSDLKNALGR